MRTLTGTIVIIVAVYDGINEALVQFPSGDFAQFTCKNLRGMP